jgi:hypothetical protein
VIVNTWIVTYLLLSFLSLLVGVTALAVGVSVARTWQRRTSSEERYQLEKQVYLSMTLVMLGLYLRFALVPLWFFMLQSLVPSVPGAMCLAGVHMLKTPYSFISTTLKFVLPMAYGYWLALNALDRKLETQPLMTRKLYTLIPIGALLFLESVSDLRFLLSVRPMFVNCCSSIFDDSASALLQKMTYSGWGWVVAYFAIAVAMIAVSLTLWRNPRGAVGAALWILGPAVLIAFAGAVHTRLSPLFLHARFHHCIFCVWQKLPDMIAATGAVCIGGWASIIFAATRGVHRFPGAGAIADAHARMLLKWTIGALIAACGLVAFRVGLAFGQ